MMILLALLALLSFVAVVATVLVVARDGYRPVPTRESGRTLS
jgi:hypothetical protein